MPQCIGPVEDQGECGSCWAFSSSSMIADRFCIQSKGEFTTRFSPQEMINCNYENYGCGGGYLMTSIEYLQNEGVVPLECDPYLDKQKTCNYKCNGNQTSNYTKSFCKIGSLKVSTKRADI